MRIGFGTAAIGRPQYINIKSTSQKAAFDRAGLKAKGRRVLDAALTHGVRYFDTAPGYGLAEELLIEWLADQDDQEIEVATKWGYTYTADFRADATQHEVKEHSLEKLNEQWTQSQRLLPFLSTYQIHSATLETGVLDNEAVLDRLAELKAEHGLKIGLTTTGANQLEVLQKALDVEVNGAPLFEVFQVTYNILDQSLAPVLQNPLYQDKRFVIKEALANGRLFPNSNYPHYQPLYEYLQSLADQYEVGIDAITLRYCIDSVQPFTVLSGASEEQHLYQNVQANTFALAEEELHRLHHFSLPQETYWAERKKLSWN